MSADDVLVEWRIQPPRGAGSGTRVLADGQCQDWSAAELDVDGSHRAVMRPQEPAWRTSYRYTAEEMVEVRAAIARAAGAGLAARYPSPQRVHDAATLEVRFGAELGGAHVIVEGHPANAVPALVEMQRRLGELHRWPKETSRWRVAQAGQLVERTMAIAMIESKRLQAVAAALYDDRRMAAAGDGAAFEPGAAPLLAIDWFEDGRASGGTRLYPDGSLTEVEAQTERLRRRLTPEGLRAVEQALAALELASLPDPASPP